MTLGGGPGTAMVLEGIRILDWTVWQQGSVATAMLADLGAEVIKIEAREGGDPGRALTVVSGVRQELGAGRNAFFEKNNLNKKSITLDLKKPQGKDVLYRLVEKSDVFVQNFRHGVAARLGLDYQTLSLHNPKLVYASATGYGPRGTEAAEPSYDLLGLARSGFMTLVGEPEMPPPSIKPGFADQAGAIMLAYGVLAALLARERLGVGQQIHTSLLSSMIAFEGAAVSGRLLTGEEPKRRSRTSSFNPLYNHYRCSDGRWIALAMLQADRYWHGLCEALGIQRLEREPRFESTAKRADHCEELISIMDRVFATRPAAEWVRVLKEGRDMICTTVNTLSDLIGDPQVLANEYIIDYDHPVLGSVKLVGPPVQLSKTPCKVRLPAPELGEHTEQLLVEVGGYSWDEVARLREIEVI